ncbi:helix-turn-helix domain-containing protein [Ornithinibacillus halotolerans]|uniref:HTH cro/C1-type domain-containing protein n=1 Tax=Ornithinibacillus halotolerans TaxID=1274357 RepID=A0A916W3W7_9BACI|nr:helix-turn-helix transcriptional regulator [Ornithinibacillus halotolerans]GGA65296.1 hypothetical protein GCM10008025_06430 [Ornithinibacillus halotolerans]
MKEIEEVFGRILGSTIRAAREKAGFSILKLALIAGIDRSTLERIERGESIPSSFTLYKIRRIVPFDLTAIFDKVEKETHHLDLDQK